MTFDALKFRIMGVGNESFFILKAQKYIMLDGCAR